MSKLLGLCFLTSLYAFGAVDGVVFNATTGKPQAAVSVSLVHPGAAGMETLGSATSDAAGKFRIDKDVPSPPALLQSIYQGVTYNLIVQPGAPTSGLRVVVNETTKNPAAAKIIQHIILLQPGADGVVMTENFELENSGQTTFQDPDKGSVQFFVPKEVAGNPEVTVNAPGGMPIRRSAEKTAQAGIFKINYPLKPGETVFEVSYQLPPTTVFSGKVVGDAPLRLATPASVTLSGEALKDIGQEPQTQAHIYEVSGATFEAKIEGLGSLASSTQQQGEDDGSPKMRPGEARIYSRLYWVLGLAMSILAAGGFMLFRKGSA